MSHKTLPVLLPTYETYHHRSHLYVITLLPTLISPSIIVSPICHTRHYPYSFPHMKHITASKPIIVIVSPICHTRHYPYSFPHMKHITTGRSIIVIVSPICHTRHYPYSFPHMKHITTSKPIIFIALTYMSHKTLPVLLPTYETYHHR